MAVQTFLTDYESPLGPLVLASDGERLTGLWMQDQKYFGSTLPEKKELQWTEAPVFAQARRWLDLYFAGKKPDFTPPLAPAGSPFRQAVWAALRRIPYGGVTTYGQIARELKQGDGCRVSAQAVGGAVGHNPISILIPCHRVVGADGSLTGYAGGVEKKLFLLQLEGAPMEGLFAPKKGTAL